MAMYVCLRACILYVWAICLTNFDCVQLKLALVRLRMNLPKLFFSFVSLQFILLASSFWLWCRHDNEWMDTVSGVSHMVLLLCWFWHKIKIIPNSTTGSKHLLFNSNIRGQPISSGTTTKKCTHIRRCRRRQQQHHHLNHFYVKRTLLFSFVSASLFLRQFRLHGRSKSQQ